MRVRDALENAKKDLEAAKLSLLTAAEKSTDASVVKHACRARELLARISLLEQLEQTEEQSNEQ